MRGIRENSRTVYFRLPPRSSRTRFRAAPQSGATRDFHQFATLARSGAPPRAAIASIHCRRLITAGNAFDHLDAARQAFATRS